MASLAALKAQSQSMLGKIKQQSEQQSQGSRGDDNIWTPMFDKERGAGYAKVRFLPAPEGEDFPFVTVYSHGFKGPTGKWYIENSLSTNKKKDPVGEMNSRLWNSGIESDKQVARSFKRRTNLYANVLIIDDPMRPELNGTVKLYRYGPMIQKILENAMFPQFETDTPVNPFDPWSGADFEIRMVGKQLNGAVVPNYEKSFFHEPSSLGDDETIEETWKKCNSLQELLGDSNFKSYDELKGRLYEVLGATVGSGVPVVEGYEAPVQEAAPVAAPVREVPVAAPVEDKTDDIPWDNDPKPATQSKSDVDDDLDFFNNL